MAEYTYDLRVLTARATALKAALPGVTVLYAMKANGHPAVVGALASVCDGVDVASAGELALALASGARRIVCSGPAKTGAFLAEAAAAGAMINVESVTELHRLGTLGVRATVCLRVNRRIELPGATHRMTGQFGIEEAGLPEALRVLRGYPRLEHAGWHLHAVSGNLDVAAHNVFISESLAWAGRYDLPVTNLGGGFGVDYTGDQVFDPSGLEIPVRAGQKVIVEPGRWLTAEAGTYSARVADIKQVRGVWFVIVNGGMHQFRTPAAYGISFPFSVEPETDWPYAWSRPVLRQARVTVAGELCTPNDVLARDAYVEEVRVGDTLIFGKAGAYGWDISPHQYLRHPSPQFVILS
jgi:diaminopimelate decarboxylase